MRRALFSFFLFATASLSTIAPAFGQQAAAPQNGLQWYTTVMPWRQGNTAAAFSQAAAATTIPQFSYTITSNRDGNTYSGTIVGRSPFFHGARETDIKVFIIPVKIHMPDTGHTFDPTATDPFGCLPAGKTALSLAQGSPLFTAPGSDWTMNGVDVGAGQYNDVFQRAEFFTDISATGNRYHTVMKPITTLSAVTFNVPTGEGKTYTSAQSGGCGDIGVVDINTLQSFLESTEIPALSGSGVGPTNFPFFLLYNVVMGNPGTDLFSNCCVIGYHGGFGSPLQTYTPTDFDSTGIFSGLSDTSVFAHEIGEWLNDPTGNNPTPAWGHIGQVSGCQSNLEVGDPLSGTLFPSVLMPNGFTYNLQELAFFSWFYSSTSLGANGFFSDNETFANDAGAPCT